MPHLPIDRITQVTHSDLSIHRTRKKEGEGARTIKVGYQEDIIPLTREYKQEFTATTVPQQSK